MITRAWIGGVAALLLLDAAPAAAQIHGKPTHPAATGSVSETMSAPAPPPPPPPPASASETVPRPAAPTPVVSASKPVAAPRPPTSGRVHGRAARARYADCMRRYRDREGCRYLAWRRRS
ncbi:MAG: hypothetical protein ACR2FH_09715 [Caulobacteraceae bacterium]